MTIIRRSPARALNLTDASAAFRERFWSKVDRRGPDECWPWLAYCRPDGYGQFTLRKGVFTAASRVALALAEPIKEGEFACHRCDNPPCVNPGHLFPGTVTENALDSVRKGRAKRARGEATPSAKLTEAQVREIRAFPDRLGLCTDLGRQYGVAANTIRSIRLMRKWRHVA